MLWPGLVAGRKEDRVREGQERRRRRQHLHRQRRRQRPDAGDAHGWLAVAGLGHAPSGAVTTVRTRPPLEDPDLGYSGGGSRDTSEPGPNRAAFKPFRIAECLARRGLDPYPSSHEDLDPP